MSHATGVCEPRIYVACLAAYNNGLLHGAWIRAAQDEEAMNLEVLEMLDASPVEGAEEYAIHDYEGFCGVHVGEYMPLERVVALGAFVSQHGGLGAAILRFYDDEMDEASEALTDRYQGVFATTADYLQDLTEETIDIPTALAPYIDWSKMAHDAELNGDIFSIEIVPGEVHIFLGR